MQCPHGRREVKYTLLKIFDPPVAFFYCDKNNDILYRKSDERRVPLGDPSKPEYVTQLRELWESIVRTAPPSRCGGHFELWTNVKCPHCSIEFPYNRGVKDPS